MRHPQDLRSSDLVLWDIMEEHLGEAGFHGQIRRDELCAHGRTLDDVGETEERLFAHIDGLVLGGALVEDRLLVPALAGDDSELAFAAALSLLCSEVGDRSDWVVDHLAHAGMSSLAGIAEALELLAPAHAQEHLRSLQELGGNETVRAAAATLLARRGFVPSPRAVASASGAGPLLLAALLEAVRATRDPQYRSFVSAALDHPDPGVRDAAVVTGLVHGMRLAWRRCVDIVSATDSDLRQALCLLALLGGDEELALLERCLASPAARTDAVFALGYTGRSQVADLCIEIMQEGALAPHAAEAFAFITGANLEGEGLFAATPESGKEGGTFSLDDGDQDAVAADESEASLPAPQVEVVAAWWQNHRGRFDPRQRYLQGRVVTPESYRAAFASASTKRRRDLALEIAIRTAGAVIIQTSALARVQRAQEQRVATLPSSLLTSPLAALQRS